MTTTQKIRETLIACPEFSDAESTEIDALVHHCRLQKYHAGDVIWSQGEKVSCVYLPIHGLVRIAFQGSEGDMLTTALIQGSHLLGEAELFAGIPKRFNEACALSALEVICIPAGEFKTAITNSAKLTSYWLRQSNLRFVMALKHAQLMSMRTAEDRLRWLIKLMLSFTPAEQNDTVILPFSQETIGNMASLSRQVTCKVVVEWRESGLVDTAYQRLIILNRKHFLD
jgi:CRP-like cAMP-binding protein